MSFYSNLLGSAGVNQPVYKIPRSVRFNSSDSAYLSRTPASAGNRKTWTWAGWVKRSRVNNTGLDCFFACVISVSDYVQIAFQNNTNYLGLYIENTSGTAQSFSSGSYRDLSAWYHIVISFDSTQSTASNRLRVYVNGAEITYSTDARSSIVQNTDFAVNSTNSHSISSRNPYAADRYFSGYLADVHFIDGQALDPTSFGEFDDNGIWQPIGYTGTYGTNGFHLDFSDNSTAAALGTDTSGNGNTWTVNNISVTAGAGNDSLVDVPTNGTETDTGVGGEVRGNYATLNPLAKDGGTTLSNGNLDISSTNYGNNTATFFLTSGKWYWEGQGTGYVAAICGKSGINWNNTLSASGSNSIGWWYNGPVYWDGGNNSGSTTYGSSDIVGTALDMDAGVVYFYKNGSLVYTITFGSGTVPDLSDGVFPCYNHGSASGTKTAVYNFGQRPFAYTAPSGFKALCTANLDAPVVTKPSECMDVALYTGNGSTQTISGLDFSPDLVWIKNRAAADSHKLTDTVRGAIEELESNTTDAEVTNADGLTAFNSDGFDLGADVEYNTSTETYVAWNWDAGSSTVTNTDGSITSTVRANPSAGFSIVTYTGTLSGPPGTAPTVGHGLGVKPALIISKSRNNSGDSGNWYVNHSYNYDNFLRLNTTAAAADISANGGGTEADPTSTVFSTYYINGSNVSGATYVAYCFAPVDGYSSFGSYTGNGSADGPFVYTGFRPRWIMIKNTTTTAYPTYTGWAMFDSSRTPYNVAVDALWANSSQQEGLRGNGSVATSADFGIDFLSNGFQLRDNNVSELGLSGAIYIYAAFAENPFALNARAR